ncbi:hypothetical protein A8A57_02910 [Lelliottia amnigena]|nr:hypothetical protein A8A57_02910 [Lelliottia amnigena]
MYHAATVIVITVSIKKREAKEQELRKAVDRFWVLFSPSPVGEGGDEGISAHLSPHPNPLPKGEGILAPVLLQAGVLFSPSPVGEGRGEGISAHICPLTLTLSQREREYQH